MAHWAEIDEDSKVLRVLVTDNNMPEEGKDWLEANLGGRWVQTSYNTLGGIHLLGGEPFRKNYAGVGFTYDEDLDAFVPPKPFESWVLDTESCLWVAPIPQPNLPSTWNEEAQSWDLIELD
jgi:hypothetical protein